MMGGRAFILLKVGRGGPKSSKQTEIRLAYLLKILRISRFGTKPTSSESGTIARGPATIPLDMDNSRESPVLLSGSQFRHVNERNVQQ
jgi:hypothetical protein